MFNQFTEQFSVNQLADIVKREGAKLGLDVQVGVGGEAQEGEEGGGGLLLAGGGGTNE